MRMLKFRKIISLFCGVVFMLGIMCSCAKSKVPPKKDDYSEILKEYKASECTVKTSDKDLKKVNIIPTFDVTKHTNSAEGILEPYGIFADGMCLQRDSVVKIFGTAPKITKNIAIIFRENIYYGDVIDGDWTVYLPKMTAGGPYVMEIVSSIGRISIKDVYVGEVYLLSGQSNMEFTSYWNNSKISDLYSDAEACKNDNIRLANVQQKRQVGQPISPVKFEKPVNWQGASSTVIRGYSAVGYIFGKEMQKKLGCPIGLVCNAMGGSLIEYWMSQDAYKDYKSANVSYLDKTNDVLTNSLGFNGSVYPLGGYVFRGVVWYQGESNVNGSQKCYANALKVLMNDWRTFFDNENMTFTFCELARFNQDPVGYSTVNAKINEVASEDKLTAVAINVDQGDFLDIHPADKHAIGERAASETLRLFFGKTENTAPKIVNVDKIDANTVEITLDEEVVLVNGNNGFEVKTSLGWEFSATAQVNGKVLTVSSENEFTQIRYGYTTKIDSVVREDVSKFVTLFDVEGYPMDLFLIDLSK